MSKINQILAYILGFFSALLVVLIVLLTIFKVTVFNEKYVLKKLDNYNYYEKVYKDIYKQQEHVIHSSGLNKSVLKNLYTDMDVKENIQNSIKAFYRGQRYEVDLSDIQNNLKQNIDEFLTEKNLTIDDKDFLDSYMTSIVKIYKDEVSLYGYLNGSFLKLYKYVKNISIIIVLLIMLLSILIYVVRKFLHKKYIGVIMASSSMMLIYIKYFIYEKIDFRNILIISDNFSYIIRKILNDINDLMLLLSISLLIFGIVFIVKDSLLKVKRVRRIR